MNQLKKNGNIKTLIVRGECKIRADYEFFSNLYMKYFNLLKIMLNPLRNRINFFDKLFDPF